MSCMHDSKGCLASSLLLAVVVVLGIVVLGFVQPAWARDGARGHYEFRDTRHHHDRDYPVRGHYIDVLPRGHRVVIFHNSPYYFWGGVWYRPYGPRFAVIAPPIGIVVPFLPLFYTTIWIGGIPYYYANEVYYVQRPDGYMVVEPPKGEAVEAPVQTGQMYIYPRKGQSEEQQAKDRYECHRWAVGQSGYDPTQPPGSLPEAQAGQKRADYQRAMGACLDGRGYTAK